MFHDFMYQRNMKVQQVEVPTLSAARSLLYSCAVAETQKYCIKNGTSDFATNVYCALILSDGSVQSLYLNIVRRSGVITYTPKWSNTLNFYSN